MNIVSESEININCVHYFKHIYTIGMSIATFYIIILLLKLQYCKNILWIWKKYYFFSMKKKSQQLWTF